MYKKYFCIFSTIFLMLSACATSPDLNAGKRAYNAGDYETALYHYNELAAFGHPKAKTELGKMYLYGKGAPLDPRRALELFMEAEALGDKNATNLIPKAQEKLDKQTQTYKQSKRSKVKVLRN